jgi:hydrogenase expression/formation protein HypE
VERSLPVGKLPHELLAGILAQAQVKDPRIILGPGIGLDCAVIEAANDILFALKTDPITFASDEIGWYGVQINANDIATSGATPRWFLVTILLPERGATSKLAEDINRQLQSACQDIGVTIIGGHTEITHSLDQPILVGTMIGEVSRENLVTPQGALPGDKILLTKGVPIEATALLAGEFPEKLCKPGPLAEIDLSSDKAPEEGLSQDELEQARAFLYTPGISVLRDARIATRAGKVHAMHDPTEGGLYTAVWELVQASGHSMIIDPALAPVPHLSTRICRILGLDPLGAIASGALLLVVPASESRRIQSALNEEGIACTHIGEVLDEDSPSLSKHHQRPRPAAWRPAEDGLQLLPYPERDEIARLFSE